MALQTTVNTQLAFGVPGSFYDDSPRRVAPYSVEGGAIARIYTINPTDPTKAVLGGNGVIAGIAVNSKEYPISGLTATLEFKQGAIAQLASMGHIIVMCENEVSVGNAAFYNTTTGTIRAATPAEQIEGYVEIPNSQFIYVNGVAGEVAVLQLS